MAVCFLFIILAPSRYPWNLNTIYRPGALWCSSFFPRASAVETHRHNIGRVPPLWPPESLPTWGSRIWRIHIFGRQGAALPGGTTCSPCRNDRPHRAPRLLDATCAFQRVARTHSFRLRDFHHYSATDRAHIELFHPPLCATAFLATLANAPNAPGWRDGRKHDCGSHHPAACIELLHNPAGRGGYGKTDRHPLK